MKLFDSEIKVMNILWEGGALTAGQLVKILEKEAEWNKNTTYTVIKKCIKKGAIQRTEPNFLCTPLVRREEILHYETQELISKMSYNSTTKFLTAFLQEDKLTTKEIEDLQELLNKLK
ncbi:MAG: BlaI/MecI/CopY family transcriptional regulator [Lachnospiraceae bacterium]|nr:BlaI/MecI/CopY family transcriptional regulator [Lachnospiraceae bacterium]